MDYLEKNKMNYQNVYNGVVKRCFNRFAFTWGLNE